MQSGHSATQRQMAPPPHMSQRPPASSSAVGPPLHSSSGVTTSSGLPKIDIAAALSRDMQQHAHPPPPPAPHHGDQLVLPPHPDSHSRSSEGADPHGDQSFGAAKAAAPRAEQFEDRLKTIIHSVLTGDEQKEAAAAAAAAAGGVHPGGSGVPSSKHHLPLHLGMPHGGPGGPMQPGAGSSKPMFSPVKKELPTNLPLPPAGVGGSSSNSGGDPHHPHPHHSLRGQPGPPPSHHPHNLPPGDVKPDIKPRHMGGGGGPYAPPPPSHGGGHNSFAGRDSLLPPPPPSHGGMRGAGLGGGMHGPPGGMEDYHRTPKAAHSTPSMSRVPPRSSPQSQSRYGHFTKNFPGFIFNPKEQSHTQAKIALEKAF